MLKSLISLLMVVSLLCCVTNAATLVDDFNSGLSSDRWEAYQIDVSDAPWTIQVPDSAGRVKVSKSADSSIFKQNESLKAGILSRFALAGDFSAWVDFDLVNLPLTNRSGWNEAVMAVGTNGGTISGDHVSVLRFTDSGYQLVEGFTSAYGPLESRSDSTIHGRLGLIRQGETISTWIEGDNGLICLGSISSPMYSAPFKLEIFASQVSNDSQRPSNALDIRFDNFVVTADTIIGIPEPTTLSAIILGCLFMFRKRWNKLICI